MGYIDINDTPGASGGSATSANQEIQINTLDEINNKTLTPGQAISDHSSPIVIASDQSTIPVNLTDSLGTSIGTVGNPLFVNSISNVGRTSVNQYSEVLSVPSGSSTIVVQYTVPSSDNFILERISVSGENIAMYQILVNGTIIETQRSYFGGELNCQFNFISSGNQGYILNIGDVVQVTVLHNRPSIANFEGRIQMSIAA